MGLFNLFSSPINPDEWHPTGHTRIDNGGIAKAMRKHKEDTGCPFNTVKECGNNLVFNDYYCECGTQIG